MRKTSPAARIKGFFKTPRGTLTGLWVAFFLNMAGMAAFVPYVGLYYESINLQGWQIGQLSSIRSLVSFISSILLAFLSDVLRRHKLILRACILIMITALLIYPHAASFTTLLPIVMLYSITLSPTNSILTRTTLNTLDNPRDYSIVRMGGSIGWGIITLVTGLLLDTPAFDLNIIFSVHIFFLILLFIFSWFLPETDPSSNQSGGNASPKDIWNMLRLPAFLPWMGVIFLWGLTEASVSSFLFLHIKHIGGSPALMGTALSVSLLGEIATLAAAKRIQNKLGSRRMMILAFVVRVFWFTAAAALREPSLILVNMFIGGTSFSLIHAGGVAYINQRAPGRISTTAQALRGAFQFGLGGAAGALISGALYQAYGSAALYRIMAGVSLLGLFLALLLRSVEHSREKTTA